VYDTSSPRQTFAHWDSYFIEWMAKRRFDADFCTDVDIHQGKVHLENYELLLSVGHDEYWSEATRTAVEAFVRNGGNLAIFGANTCWWKVDYVDDDSAIRCCKPEADLWWRQRPEEELTGLSFRHGGGWWRGEREQLGYSVLRDTHWVFEGTHLRASDVFGADEHLVGYECDGVLFEHGEFRPSPRTPALEVLAVATLSDAWRVVDRAEKGSVRTATIAMFSNHGTVFNCGTADWARVVLSNGVVDRITSNVIRRLAHRPR
jgi:hypothetical protein